jgi:hypothetical protein
MVSNKTLYYVKHQVNPDSENSTARNVLKTIKDKMYIYIPFKVNHYIYNDDKLRKECGVFLLKEINNPLSIVPEIVLLKTRSKSGFNKLTLTLSKEDPADKKKTLIKRATVIFSREYYTPELATKIAGFKEVSFEKGINWKILTITGPTERFKLKVDRSLDEIDSKKKSEDKTDDKKDDGGSSSKIIKDT